VDLIPIFARLYGSRQGQFLWKQYLDPLLAQARALGLTGAIPDFSTPEPHHELYEDMYVVRRILSNAAFCCDEAYIPTSCTLTDAEESDDTDTD
jgi:hypothetical protein